MSAPPTVRRLGRGVVLVSDGVDRHVVWVAGPPADRWAFWNGQLFRSTAIDEGGTLDSPGPREHAVRVVTAPMPATVIRVLVAPGALVERGTPTVVLEAMKMELALRAPIAGRVRAVYCREGDLVQADQALVEVE